MKRYSQYIKTITFIVTFVINDRSHELMRKQLVLLILVCISFVWLLFQIDTSVPGLLVPTRRIIDREFQAATGFIINTLGCRIQYMDPFDDTVHSYVTEYEDPIECNMFKVGRLVKADIDSVYIDFEVLNNISWNNSSLEPSQVKCQYSEFWRTEHPLREDGVYPSTVDTDVVFSSKTVEITNRTKIVEEEFILVTCGANNEQIFSDFFAFPKIKPERVKSNSSLSVLMFGLDGVSRLNLHRQMPRTVDFIKENIATVEMLGYNKVGDNTFPNLVPVLSGMSEEDLKTNCWQKENVFDDCPFIWKNYKEAKFSTAFYEDAAWMGLFNYRKFGYRKQPTDFYGQIYSLMAEQEIGSDKRYNAHLCIGNRETFDVLLDNARRFIIKTKKILTWSMFWSSSLTHDNLNLPKFGDVSLTKFMEDLFQNGVFNSTIVFFMSDHGIRWGGIRYTYQGYMEERLPFLFVSFPEWFKDRYPLAVRNLRTNRVRLTTHFDLHETLLDLIDLRNVEEEAIKKRSRNLYKETKKGVSLFLPIFENRTCADAGITENWCTCYSSSPVETSDAIVQKAAEAVVEHINKLLEGYSQCRRLQIDKILSARKDEVRSSKEEQSSERTKQTDYMVSLVTTPGSAVFEATVRYSNATKDFNVIDTISRLNTYLDQSRCISHYRLKLYCYCI